MPSPVQFDLFGASVVYGAPRLFVLPLPEEECPTCRTHTFRVRGSDTYERSYSYPFEEGWEPVTAYAGNVLYYRREIPQWYFPCCDRECGSCENVISDRTDSYACRNCEACEECCDCYYCEGCEEMRSSSNHCCERCNNCCDCCPDCSQPSGYCDCGSYGSEDCDDSEDCETVTTYIPQDMSGTRTFGIELETVGIGTNRAAAALSANGLESMPRGYTHSVVPYWKVVTDSSVWDGCEAVSPILCGSDGFHQLETACLALTANGASVDNKCGTHVHIGCEDLSAREIARVVKFYDRQHALIDMLHAPSRRGSSDWSGPHSGWGEDERLTDLETRDDKRALDSFPRYRSVNLTAYSKYGTLEFRQHAGSLNARKLSAWIRFLFALIEAAKDDAPISHTLDSLLTVLSSYGLPTEDARYLSERAADLARV